MRISKRPWLRYSLTYLMMEPVLHGLRRSPRASSIKSILLAWTGQMRIIEFGLCRAYKPRCRLTSRTRLAGGLRGRRAKLSRRGKAQSENGRISKRRSLPNSRIPKVSTYSSYFPPVPLLLPRSYDLRTDRQGSQENAVAEPGGARAAASGRGGGGAITTPPASTPATSTSPSAPCSLALTEASPPHPTPLSCSPSCSCSCSPSLW